MHHVWSVICTNSSVDSRSNSLSLFNIVEEIKFHLDTEQEEIFRKQNEEGALPLPITLEIISIWWRSNIDQPELGETQLTLITPDGKRSLMGTAHIDLETHVRVRSLGKAQGIPFTVSGIYYYEISKKVNDQWETVSTIPLEILQQDQPVNANNQLIP